MLFWKVFNCSIFISSQNSIIFPMPYFSALYLVQWQQENLGRLLNLILFIFTGKDCVFVTSPGDTSFGALAIFLGDSISDKSWCEWTEMETVSLFLETALILNCPEVFTESASSLGRSWDDIKFHFQTLIPPSYTPEALGRTLHYFFHPNGKSTKAKREP